MRDKIATRIKNNIAKKEDVKKKPNKNLMIGIVAITLPISTLLATYGIIKYYQNEDIEAEKHLSKNSITIEQFDSIRRAEYGSTKLTEDDGMHLVYTKNNTGLFDGYISRKNIDEKNIQIRIAKSIDGKIIFPNLAKNAIDPLNIPEIGSFTKIDIDYVDTNNDDSLESITYSTLNNKRHYMKIERINGEYTVSKINPKKNITTESQHIRKIYK
jgi:hypothetical protein